VVLDAVPALEQAPRLEDTPGQLTHEVGGPPEPTHEHDQTGHRKEDRPNQVAEQEASDDERDHGPLMGLARSDIEGFGRHR
jgi:hypothetical protein